MACNPAILVEANMEVYEEHLQQTPGQTTRD